MTLGQRIQELRKQAGLSQEGLGEALGVSRQAVSKWESDGGIPELDTIIAMSKLFGISIGALLGVEEQKEEVPPSGQTDWEQMESILRVYLDSAQKAPEEPGPWYQKLRWPHLLGAVAALALVVVLFVQIATLRTTVRRLRSDVSSLEVQVSNQVGNLSGQIRNTIYDVLAEEAELLNTYQWSIRDFDLEEQTVTVDLTATLKEYQAGSTLQFVLDWVRADGSEGETAGEFVPGPDFAAAVTLPMNTRTDVSIRLKDEAGNIKEQWVDYIYSLNEDSLRLEGYNLMAVFQFRISSFGKFTESTRAEDPRLEVFTAHPDLFWPETASITASVNGETVFSAPVVLTKSEESEDMFLGRIQEGYFDVDLKEYDQFEVVFTVTDSLGRTQEFRDSLTVNEGELKRMPTAAPLAPDRW